MLRLLLVITLTTFLISDDGENQSLFTGNANFYYISTLDDGEIIRMPYRMLNTTFANQNNNFEFVGKLALEYQPQNNYSYRMDNPQDFNFDLRELYMAWFLDFGEIRIGKQIQSWGFVDENSPLDNSCAYDYNFLFETGADRKIATTALSADLYYKNLTFGFTASPFHSINRLPVSNSEFPIDLPVIPNDYQFLESDKSGEYGAYIQLSTDMIDLGISYFNGYDRIYNFAGVNIPKHLVGQGVYALTDNITGEDILVQDTVFTYRKTEVLGLGGAAIIKDLTLRADAGYFISNYTEDNIERPYYNPDPLIPNSFTTLDDEPYESIPSLETAEYYQVTIQAEYNLPFNMNLLFQYFKHDTLSYKSKAPLKDGECIDIDSPDVSICGFDPYDFFYPGMGSPLALMVNKAILGGLSKSFLNDRLTLQLRNLMDLEYKGYFLELNTDYKLTDRVTSTFAINYINGDETHPNSIKNKGEDYEKALDYPLNQMEDFSHIRMQIKYSF
tara:strand:+ start:8084 stop:9586 length:1503 start_codon:yes stop_codon:yes gene_type:complete